jgi:hypothetical protein
MVLETKSVWAIGGVLLVQLESPGWEECNFMGDGFVNF